MGVVDGKRCLLYLVIILFYSLKLRKLKGQLYMYMPRNLVSAVLEVDPEALAFLSTYLGSH